MARPSGEPSNQILPDAEKIFRELEDWNRILRDTSLRPLDEGQRLRATTEARDRSSRLRTGVGGIRDRLTGRHAQTVKQTMPKLWFRFDAIVSSATIWSQAS